MARRSRKASTAGIEKAKRAFEMKQWTQEYLANEVGLETHQAIDFLPRREKGKGKKGRQKPFPFNL